MGIVPRPGAVSAVGLHPQAVSQCLKETQGRFQGLSQASRGNEEYPLDHPPQFFYRSPQRRWPPIYDGVEQFADGVHQRRETLQQQVHVQQAL
ncbi:hypothetical protein D9M70_599610 [compost metagenome]